MSMDTYLDARTSLIIVRAASANRSLALVPTDARRPVAPASKPVKLWRLGASELLSFLRVPEERNLGIVVPSAQARVRSQGLSCTVDAMRRDGSGFLRLTSADERAPSPIVPKQARVFVMSPPNIVLSMAGWLRDLEVKGGLTHLQALLMLVKLCLELCGTYSHDPFAPNSGDAQYSAAPHTSRQELIAFLGPAGREKGLTLARRAAGLVYDRSGSPQESYLGPALFFEPQLGGLGLCEFEANVPLDLTPKERAAIGYRTITPDFQLKGHNAVVEYLGSVHEEGDNPRIDHRRRLDYQTLGRREFGFWYEDVDTLPHFTESASRLVEVIEQHDGPKARRRFARLCGDAAFRERQRIMASVFKPWLRERYGMRR